MGFCFACFFRVFYGFIFIFRGGERKGGCCIILMLRQWGKEEKGRIFSCYTYEGWSRGGISE